MINSYELMLDCWKGNPEERPTFAYLISALEEMMTEDAPYFDPSKVDEAEPCYSDAAAASTSKTLEMDTHI